MDINALKGTGNKNHNWQVLNRQGEVKNCIGNGEAKELRSMIHGHDLRGECQREWGYHVEGDKGEKKMGQCNSVINKIYLKKLQTRRK